MKFCFLFLFLFKLIFNRDITSVDIYLVSFRFVRNMSYYLFNKLLYLESSLCCSSGKIPPDRRSWEIQHLNFLVWLSLESANCFPDRVVSFSRWYWFYQHLEILITHKYISITGKVRACSIFFFLRVRVISLNEVHCKRFNLIVRLTFEFTNLMKQISSSK